jgi:hypothetical protein
MRATIILGMLGSTVTLVVLFEMLRRHKLREKYAVFWAVVAVLTLVVAAFPIVLDRAAALVGVAVPANLLFFVASMLLLVVSVQHSSELGRLEERSRTLAEELALLQMEVTHLREQTVQAQREISSIPD